MIARQILRSGEWLTSWGVHWVYPLHKRKSKSASTNYRASHLTTQVSKVIERVLGKLFLPYLEKIDAAGPC